MPDASVPPLTADQTSTDDVRRVRVDLDRRFRGDISKLCAHAHRVSARYIQKLHLKFMPTTVPSSHARDRRRHRNAAASRIS
ncbi:MAG: hypothetical protein HKL96_08690 [Phycisphaerales bacterium]|nr:hypothetical protein [Phycisphaerales bacterium]